jgi:hypothetical protein
LSNLFFSQLNGFKGGTSGQIILIKKIGAGTLTLINQSATVENKLALAVNKNFVIAANITTVLTFRIMSIGSVNIAIEENNTLLSMLDSAINGADNALIGTIIQSPRYFAPRGYIPAMGHSIGKATGSYTGDTMFGLYEVVWETCQPSNSIFTISSAKGSSALLDWNGGKTITLDFSGRFIRTVGGNAAGPAQRQDDAFQGHQHTQKWPNYSGGRASYRSDGPPVDPGFGTTTAIVTDGTNGTPRTASETRPVNTSMYTFIRYSNKIIP